MPAIGPGLVGHALDPIPWEWDDRDVMLYALGIGARLPEDLDFVYEGPPARGPSVAATFPLAGTTLALFPLVDALGIDLRALLHASQAIALHRVPASAGRAIVTRTVTGVWDKGRAAILDCEDVIADDDGVLAVAQSAWWVEGAGGFGGQRGPAAATVGPAAIPAARAPELTRTFATTAEQAALHRLSGDRNPVHIDPALARAAGQPRPFLHGLCGFAALGHALDRAAARRGERLASLGARFTRPVFPGEALTIEAWDRGTLARVRVGDDVVLGPARAAFAAA